MQPKSKIKIDKEAFERIKKKVKNISRVSRGKKSDSSFAVQMPEEVGLQLTYRCNLRCNHCFQWNDEGFFHSLEDRGDLDFEIINKVFHETRDVKSNIYLWGGEPLVYKEWEPLTDLLVKDPRWTVICTNAILIGKKIDSLIKISENTVLLISLEGFEEGNDAIRGKGTFKKVMENLELLFELKRKGIYKGLISINTVLNDNNISELYDLALFFENKPVDSFYISYNWHIPGNMAKEMDSHFHNHFQWLDPELKEKTASWHSFTYRIKGEVVPQLKETINRINEREWKIRVKFQPPLALDAVENFVSGLDAVNCPKTECLAINYRMDVLPDGTISSCKLFPEFVVGNLKDHSLKELWQGEHFNRIRKHVSQGLMPVCKRCVLLYLHGK